MYGDGVRLLGLLGSPLKWVEQVWIEDCLFTHNGRSGIAVQRLVRGVTIRGNDFTRIQDQAIDMEPSDAGASDIAPRDFEIINNRFFDTAPLALTITGVGSGDRARNVVVSDNVFTGTGIFLFNSEDVRIERNVISSGYGWAPIEIRKKSERIWIVENDIDARATGKAAIVLTYHTSAAPRSVYVIDNTIRTNGSSGISARDSEVLQVTGNNLLGEGGVGINVHDIVSGTPLTSFLIENNELVGYETGVRFVSAEDPMTNVCVRSNSFRNVENPLLTSGPVQLGCN
jgi:hypothetical protein